MTELSIVIVSFNARPDLAACLSSLADHPPAIRHEVIVVDNASTDGSAEAARRVGGVRVLALERNTGFSAANNAGIRAGRGDLILLLNSDTVAPPGAVDALVGRLLAVTDAAIAGPRLMNPAGQPELSFGAMITPAVEFRRKRLMRRIEQGDPGTLAWLRAETAREQFVDWVSGACLLVRRTDAEAVGLLDERFFLYTEDVDFCHAVRQRGRKVLFTPAATITHLRGRSRAARADESERAYRRSHLAFYEKHLPLWAPLLRVYSRMKRLTNP